MVSVERIKEYQETPQVLMLVKMKTTMKAMMMKKTKMKAMMMMKTTRKVMMMNMTMLLKHICSPQSLTLAASTYFTRGYTNTASLYKIIFIIHM